MKRLSLLASAALFGVAGVAFAQNTVLGPSITTVSAGTGATMAALAANSARKAVTICNGSFTFAVTFTTGTATTPVSLTTGIVLASNLSSTSCFTLGPQAGAGVGAQINVISSGASAPVSFIEYY